MRYAFTIPTVESMARKAPRPEKPLTAEEVLAQNQRERSARQAGRRRLSPASSKKADIGKRNQKSVSGGQASKSLDNVESAEGSGSESEDGYMSSSSSGSVDRRKASTVRNDVLSEVLGASSASSKNESDDARSGAGSTSSPSVPQDLKPEAHEHIIYLAGNSLGLQSKSSYQLVNEELVMWQTK